MTRHWRRALVGASVLSLGFGGATFAAGDKQQTEVQQEQSEQALGGAGQQGQAQQPQTQQQPPSQQGIQEQAQLKGEVVQVKKDTVYLRLDEGAVLPFKVSQQSQLEGAEERATGGSGQAGQPEKAKGQQEQQMKGKKLTQHLQPGDKLNVTLTSKGKENIAERIQLDQQSAQEKEIQGTIASKSGNWVNLQYEGALIPLKLDRQTTFEGVKNQQALREGTQVRANFRVEDGTNNVATRVTVQNQEQGKGGSGEEGQPEAVEPAQGQTPEPGQFETLPEGQGGSFEEGQSGELPQGESETEPFEDGQPLEPQTQPQTY